MSKLLHCEEMALHSYALQVGGMKRSHGESKELLSVTGAEEEAPEGSQMEPGTGTAVSRHGHCSCLKTGV